MKDVLTIEASLLIELLRRLDHETIQDVDHNAVAGASGHRTRGNRPGDHTCRGHRDRAAPSPFGGISRWMGPLSLLIK
ncbi:MAG: hypothetical protein CM15mP77_2000 [Synechococcus sp.]|nr:MAG: hypothetical protein CM15mP77_2000 [Synechococcus sp.]